MHQKYSIFDLNLSFSGKQNVVHDVMYTLTTHARLVRDITGTDCRTGTTWNGSAHGRLVIATLERLSLTS